MHRNGTSVNRPLHLKIYIVKGYSLFIHTQDTATTSESIILTSVKDLLYAQLSESRRTHDAWLDRDVECCCAQGALEL